METEKYVLGTRPHLLFYQCARDVHVPPPLISLPDNYPNDASNHKRLHGESRAAGRRTRNPAQPLNATDWPVRNSMREKFLLRLQFCCGYVSKRKRVKCLNLNARWFSCTHVRNQRQVTRFHRNLSPRVCLACRDLLSTNCKVFARMYAVQVTAETFLLQGLLNSNFPPASPGVYVEGAGGGPQHLLFRSPMGGSILGTMVEDNRCVCQFWNIFSTKK